MSTVSPDDYMRTVGALASMNLSIFNGFSALLGQLAKKGEINAEDVQVIENAARAPLDNPNFSDSELVAALLEQHDEVFTALRKMVP
jgi:hypothetical protein